MSQPIKQVKTEQKKNQPNYVFHAIEKMTEQTNVSLFFFGYIHIEQNNNKNNNENCTQITTKPRVDFTRRKKKTNETVSLIMA